MLTVFVKDIVAREDGFVAIQMRLNLQALFVKNLFIERHLLAEK